MPVTNKAFQVRWQGTTLSIPKGMAVKKVQGGNGGWAIKNVKDVIAIGGDSWLAETRYVWVPVENVEEGQ